MKRKLVFTVIIAGLMQGFPGWAYGVEKPIGIFSSAGATDPEIYEHSAMRGVLIRAPWSSIEPVPGIFDFSRIDIQVAEAEANGKKWSLGVLAGGVGTPNWLIDDLGAAFVEYAFRGVPGYRLPLLWDDTVQGRLEMLADALGNEYGGRDSLALVYIPQMTSNGIEGHLQGVDMELFRSGENGFTEQRWIDGSIALARAFANAFAVKPLAFEVHEIDGSALVPATIIETLWVDADLKQRVGAAVWWVSGDENYQKDLLDVLAAFHGDIYGQVVGRSNQPTRFPEGGYSLAFAQAKALGIRYLEPWEYELKTGEDGADGEWDQLLTDYNQWADARFDLPLELGVRFEGRVPVIFWSGLRGCTYRLEKSSNLEDWEAVEVIIPQADGEISVLDTAASGVLKRFYRMVKEI